MSPVLFLKNAGKIGFLTGSKYPKIRKVVNKITEAPQSVYGSLYANTEAACDTTDEFVPLLQGKGDIDRDLFAPNGQGRGLGQQ